MTDFKTDFKTGDASTIRRKRRGTRTNRSLSMRAKLLLVFAGALAAVITVFAWGVTHYARQAFAEADRQRSDALVAQFRSEYAQFGNQVMESVQGIAEAEGTVRMALELSRPQADPSLYARDATGLAAAHHLDFLELATDDGTVMSSAQWPGRLGYRNDWITLEKNWNQHGTFLARLDLPDNVQLGVLAVRVVHVGDKNFYVIGGRQLDGNFLKSIAVPSGARTLLYRNLETSFVPAALGDSDGPAADAGKFAGMIESLQNQPRMLEQAKEERAIEWTSEQVPSGVPGGVGGEAGGGVRGGAVSPQPEPAETFAALPLAGRHNELLGALLVEISENGLPALESYIRSLTQLIAVAGILFGLVLNWWISLRVTRPVEQATSRISAVAEGNWGVVIPAKTSDEFGALARGFNEMTRRLTGERERLVQAERVTAWREMARRLAHELKEPLFPLQITIETLAQAQAGGVPDGSAEVFGESTAALRSELESLREIAARFSEFARVPAPDLQPVSVNDVIRALVKKFEPQFGGIGRPPVTPELFLGDGIARVNADPARLAKALENVLIVSVEAMPAGGTLTIRTLQKDDIVRVEIYHTGGGLGSDSVARMFTPCDDSRREVRTDAGLGLATALSIVSDHGGRIRVDSAPGAGTTFRIALPAAVGPAELDAGAACDARADAGTG